MTKIVYKVINILGFSGSTILNILILLVCYINRFFGKENLDEVVKATKEYVSYIYLTNFNPLGWWCAHLG